MAKMTSLYLCNRMVQAVVGKGGSRRVRIDAFCQAELPEGCLINGVVTNEAMLEAALKEFIATNSLPTKNTGLVLNSSQLVQRTMTLPTMPEKKLRGVVTRELAAGGEVMQPLDDYMLLAHNAKEKSDTLLATRMEKSLADSMITLAKAVGLNVTCIDSALACQIKLVSFLPALAGKTFICLIFDGDNLYSSLFENGQYKYSAFSRLFVPRGTPESAVEIVQKVSGLVQFQAASKSAYSITEVYFSGAEDGELAACTPGITDMQLKPAPFPGDTDRIALPQGCTLGEMIYTAGNLINR